MVDALSEAKAFRDKVVLVTGGSSGIGRAAVLGFAGAGAKVVLAARNPERGEAVTQEVQRQGGEACFVQADVSRVEDVERVLANIGRSYGRLDAAINNAATLDGVFALTADFTPDQFDRAVTLNLKSVWLCLAGEIRQMLAQSPSGGAIVNTSSVNALGGAAGGSLYSAAKAGVLALTKSAAQEYATKGIRINALVAGAFRTAHAGRGVYHGRWRHCRGPRCGRAAVYQSHSYVTGHSMIVDGGMTAATR